MDTGGVDKSYSEYVNLIPLQNRFKLDKTLDYEHNRVEKDLTEIAGFFVDWESKASHLGLTNVDISDIKETYRSKPELQRKAALQKWKNRLGLRATHGRLLKSFLEGGATDAAEAVCRILGANIDGAEAEGATGIGHKGVPSANGQSIAIGSVKLPDITTYYLQLIKWINPKGEEAKLNIYEEMSPKWKEVAGVIGLRNAVIGTIAAPGAGRGMIDCMRDVFGKWMENCDGLPNHKRYPLTWDGLCRILKDSDSVMVMKQLREALDAEQSTLRGTFPENIPVSKQIEASGMEVSAPTSAQDDQSDSAIAPAGQTRAPVSKWMACDELADWLEKEGGVAKEDTKKLKEKGVTERVFMKLKAPVADYNLLPGTELILEDLQEDLKKRRAS